MTTPRKIVQGIVFCLVAVLFIAAQLVRADEKADQKARQLIEKFASTNSVPPKDDGTPGVLVEVPKGYRWDAQSAVYDAADELLKMGVDAVPELLRHLKDNRYSVTELSGTGATSNHSVGDECERIVRWLIGAGAAPIWEGRGNPAYNFVGGDIDKWWTANGQRPLWKLQRECVESELKAARRRLKEPPGDFQPDMAEYVRRLEANLATLDETRQPLPAKYPRNRMLHEHQ